MDGGGALPEILHFLHRNSIAAAAAEQQQLIQLPQPITYFDENDSLSNIILFGNNDLGLGELIVDETLKAEPDIENWCDENFGRISGNGNGIELGKTSAIARTTSCPPPQAAKPAAAARGKGKAAVALWSKTGAEISFKKRKANNPTIVAEETPLEKKLKADKEKGKDSDGNNKTTISSPKESSKDNSKGLEVAKRDYIHVRARRGQATDSHSLAERVRREKISAKMKYLQNLVPGCNKITGKAGMLDEIINYVQSLQRQVEFLSMKLAAITPRMDYCMDTYFSDEMFSPCGFSIPTIGVSLLGQGASSSGLGMGINALDTTLRRTISAPICIPETGCNSSGLNQIQPFATNAELQSLYSMDLQQGRSGPFIADQPFIDFTEVSR